MNLRTHKPTATAGDALTLITDANLATALGLDSVPMPPANLPHVRVWSAWLEAPLGDDWCVALQLAVQDGRPVVSELRIFPAERPPQLVHVGGVVQAFQDAPGEWNGKWLGIHAKVPKRGLSSTIVRQARIPLHAEFFEEIRQELASSGQDFFSDDFGFPTAGGGAARKGRSPKNAPGPGRPALSLEALLPIAQHYATAIARGSRRPLQDLARQRGQDIEEIRRRVHQARRRGLLTPTSAGAASGVLTLKARRLLRQARRRSPQLATKARPRGKRKAQLPKAATDPDEKGNP